MIDPFQLATDWDISGEVPKTENNYNLVFEAIDFLHKQQFYQYIPTLGSEGLDFYSRLRGWINSTTNKVEQQTLLEFVPHLIFFGRDEFVKLHEAARKGPITRWIIDELGLSLDNPGLQSAVETELFRHTWYCPITDSMPISEFHHANQLGGIDFRPDFRGLAEFGNPSVVLNFMRNHMDASGNPCPLRRIVLLEDFVGTGTQIEAALKFASGLAPDISVLFLPLIICPDGVTHTKGFLPKYPNVRYEAVLELTPDLFINNDSDLSTRPFEDAVREAAKSTYATVVGNAAAAPRPYSAFGFRDTGACVVMYSNTPANTISFVHHQSNSWAALFPRTARIR